MGDETIFDEHDIEWDKGLIEQEYQAALKWAEENCNTIENRKDCFYHKKQCQLKSYECPCDWEEADKHDVIVKYHELKAMQEGELTESQQKLHDTINQPSHYTQGNIEVRDFIVDQKLNYNRGNIIKYVCRAAHKGKELEDLRKAMNYLQYEIDHIENCNK